MKALRLICFVLLASLSTSLLAQSLVYENAELKNGIGSGKHIVFLAGDHEYRSEETCPAIARILSKHHGFKCTVLFNVDPTDGVIEPGNNNMPGTEALETADLMVVFLRFQTFPDGQMQPIVDYLNRGDPVVGLRTSTHAFKYAKDSKFAKFDASYEGKEFENGFGRQILGEAWAGHYGKNHEMATRLDIIESEKSHPIFRGVTKPWAQSGGYWTDPIAGSRILANAQPLATMKPDAAPAKDKKPCPGVWTRTYKMDNGKPGRVFTTTYGASEDILDASFRRMLINGCIWAIGSESKITSDLNVDFVGTYNPVTFGNLAYRLDVHPSELEGWDSPIMPPNKTVQERVKWGSPRPVRNKSKSQKNKTENEQSTSQTSSNKTTHRSAALRLNKNDHICLVGSELGERMQHQNYWETSLHSLFPKHNLVVRNLCFPGDEVTTRIRSQNFGSPESHLAHSKANVILFFFGYNESFEGNEGLDDFAKDVTELITKMRDLDFNGDGTPPKIVFVSPTPYEATDNALWVNAKQGNSRLRPYVDRLAKVAKANNVGFANVFDDMLNVFAGVEARLTHNGYHLNEAGYLALSGVLNNSLFGKRTDTDIDQWLRKEVQDKNFHWWHRYRAVNGFSIYGARGNAGRDGSGTYNNRDVMERERAILDEMTANRDERIWKLAQGIDIPSKIDDSNTLPFLNPTTNVGLPGDPNAKRGKLGNLQYNAALEQQKLFELAPGYEINLFASEEQFPELANPVDINFDNQGRLWVATMPSYPHWQPKTKLDDKLLILEDNDNDGKADKCKVFAGGLHQPTGFELGYGGAFVAQQPDILFIKDTNGDDKEDTRIRKLVGFDSADSHHGIAGFYWGPGGNLYFQEGTFKFSQVESTHKLNRLGEAGIWRYNPKSEQVNVHVSFTFSNPWGFVFDKWGQDFIGDASGGLSYWAAPISGKIEYPLKHPGGSHDKRVQNFVGKEKGYKYQTLYKKRTRPLGGCEILSSRHFPDDVQGNWLVTNCIGDRSVLNHNLQDVDSGFWGTEVPKIITCKDGNFRPVNIEMAPDGSIYIVDWHNALIGHLQHNLRDPSRDKSHGRIWRITYKGRDLLDPPKIAGAPIANLLELLKIPENRTRYRAKRELMARDSKAVIAEVEKWVKSLDNSDENHEHHLLEALWMYQTHHVVNETLLNQVLNAESFQARAAAVRVLSFWLDKVSDPLALLKSRLADEHPRVRLETVRAFSFMKGDQAMEAVLDVLNMDMDYYLQYALDETMRSLEQ